MDQWYFAYGSNLLIEQLVARTEPLRAGVDELPRAARLANFGVSFNMLGDDGQIYANISPAGAGVHGILYRCGPEFLRKLDIYEGGYRRELLTVVDEQGIAIEAVVYIAQPENTVAAGRPSSSYLEKILRGAREHGLPEEYIRALEQLAMK